MNKTLCLLTVLTLCASLLTGCALSKPIKAPCHHSGWPCGQKFKINQDN